MELLQLRYFYESAKSENFSKTAKMFMVPTTSVSASIKRLETELGCTLFDRTANCIRLNANGRLLQQTLCSVFGELDRTIGELSSHPDECREIKILVRAMRRKITDLIVEYNTKHPHITFKTVFDYEDVRLDEYDIIIDDAKEQYADYESIELFDMRLQLIAAATHPLKGRKLTLAELSDQSFISLGNRSNMHSLLTRACAHSGFTPKVSAVCNDMACYEKFIAAGMGIGIAQQYADIYQRATDICYLNVADFNEHYVVYAYFQRKESRRTVKNFVSFLKNNRG